MHCVCVDKKPLPLILHRNENHPFTNRSSPFYKPFITLLQTAHHPLTNNSPPTHLCPLFQFRTPLNTSTHFPHISSAFPTHFLRISHTFSTYFLRLFHEPPTNHLRITFEPASRYCRVINGWFPNHSRTNSLPKQTIQAPRSIVLVLRV